MLRRSSFLGLPSLTDIRDAKDDPWDHICPSCGGQVRKKPGFTDAGGPVRYCARCGRSATILGQPKKG